MPNPIQIWLIPALMLIVTTLLAIPLSKYLSWIMNGSYKAPGFFKFFEHRVDSGPMNWKQYILD